jgi:hypothetical protein
MEDFWGLFHNDRIIFLPHEVRIEVNQVHYAYSYFNIYKWIIETSLDKFTIVINENEKFEIACDNPNIIEELQHTLESYVKKIMEELELSTEFISEDEE